jgi:hypothetical protein
MSIQTIFIVIAFNTLVLALPVAAIILWRKPGLWLHLWTLFVGVLVGLMDVKATEVQMTALLLIAFGFFAGFNQPRRAWRWALLLGVWVPIFAFIAMGVGLTRFRVQEQFGSLIALIPAFLGTYAGVVVKKLSERAQATPTSPQPSPKGEGDASPLPF